MKGRIASGGGGRCGAPCNAAREWGKWVAVGTAIADRPPRGSVRALLTHTARMHGVKAHARVGMHQPVWNEPAVEQSSQALRAGSSALAAPSQDVPPVASDPLPKHLQAIPVARHRVVLVETVPHTPEQVVRRSAPGSAPPRLFKGKCQSPPEPARVNPHGIGERPHRGAEYAYRCARTPFPAFRFRSLGRLGNGRGPGRPVR